MFHLFKRKPKNETNEPKQVEDFRSEFERRRQELYAKFAVEDTPYDQLLEAMSVVEHEMNHNGGGNWNGGDYDDFLETIHHHLCSDPQFSPTEIDAIEKALGEIAACGDELESNGESSRSLDQPIDYLIARVVGWCRRHDNPPDQSG